MVRQGSDKACALLKKIRAEILVWELLQQKARRALLARTADGGCPHKNDNFLIKIQ